jgi:K+-transporting ATPase ATPase A chain
MLPWLLAAGLLAAVVLTAPVLGRHLYSVFDDRPQPAWDRWLSPLESGLLRWIGETGRPADWPGGTCCPC